MLIVDSDRSLNLLHPFYLDEDMSMAFAAALAGGVALASEQVDRSEDASDAVRSLRGSLRLWRAGGAEAGRETREGSAASTESRLVRQHTVSSVFIDLHDELTRTNRLIVEPEVASISPGDLVSMRMGPAVAPLRRVVDQIIRLLNVMAPFVDDPSIDARQPARQPRAHGKPSRKPREDPGDEGFAALRKLFVALQEDLEHSGMIDVVIEREKQPSVVLTLDKRFIGPPTLELLHTSSFTVIGKVSQIWPTDEDLVNLYRRSVLSLVPRLAQTVVWNVWTFLALLGRALDVDEAQATAREAVGLPPETPASSSEPVEELEPASHASSRGTGAADANPTDSDHGQAGSAPSAAVRDAAQGGAAAPDSEAESVDASVEQDVIVMGEDVVALNPTITGPALQILPLAICA